MQGSLMAPDNFSTKMANIEWMNFDLVFANIKPQTRKNPFCRQLFNRNSSFWTW